MSNETSKPVFLNDKQVSIVKATDKLVSSVYDGLYSDEVKDDLQIVLSSLKHESIVDNILYGADYELKQSIFESIDDPRINRDNIIVHPFKKPVAKFDKDTGTHSTEYVHFVRIKNGYSDPSKMDLYVYFNDTYEGNDKNTILKLITDLRDAEKALTDLDDKIKVRKSNKEIPTQKGILDLKDKYFKLDKELKDVLSTMPTVQSQISTYEQRLDTFRKSKHTSLQSTLTNRMSTIRIALKHHKTLEAQNQLETLKEKHTSLRQLFKKIETENKLKVNED